MPTLEIEVNKPTQAEVVAKKKRRSSRDKTKRYDDPLSRRKHKQEGGIYDLGQLNIGPRENPNWIDLPFNIAPTLSVSGSMPDPIFFGLSGWTALKDKILEIPLDDFEWKYRKLEYERGEQYYVDLYLGDPSTPIGSWEIENIYSVGRANSRWNPIEIIDGSDWTPGGLRFPDSENFSFAPSLLFADIKHTKKITEEDIYASDPAEDFELKKDAKIFLVPQPVLLYGTDGTQVVLQNLTGSFGWVFGIIPRSLMLDNPALLNIVTTQLSGGEPIASPAVRTEYAYDVNPAPPVRIQIRNKARSTPNVKYFRRGTGLVDAQTFPVDARNTVAWGTYGFNNYPFDVNLAVKNEEGSLIAMINQDGNWYYVWNTVTSNSVLKQIRFEATSNSNGGGTGGGNAPPPTPIINSYPEQNGLAPTPGSGIPTKIFRRVWINIIGGYTSGPWLPQQRQIQVIRDGTVYVDVTADFSWMGWGIGSYQSDFIYERIRIFRPGHSGGSDEVYQNGSMQIKVRDLYANGALSEWSEWGSVTAVWPRDYARDGGSDQAYLEEHGYYQDES